MNPVLLLVDALGLAYRSFFAISDLSTSAGIPTNAAFGFIKTLRQAGRTWMPTHVAVVFDGGMDQRRKGLLPEYKAQRPPMPDALRTQVALIREYLRCARVASARVDGREADDVMAALAVRACAADRAFQVLMLTSDKDMFQVVDDRISMVVPARGDERMGAREVVQKTGVPPTLVPDWLALTGDSADNIPGVPGVGPKTAAKWLSEFGSIAGVFDHLSELKPERLRDALAANRPSVERNLDLVRLDTGMDPGLGIESSRVAAPDAGAVLDFFRRMEFHSFAKELETPTLF